MCLWQNTKDIPVERTVILVEGRFPPSTRVETPLSTKAILAQNFEQTDGLTPQVWVHSNQGSVVLDSLAGVQIVAY
jgi:hypothetical protein